MPQDFAQRLLHWQAEHGRRGLPWQGQQSPYRVWLSEIMLQQTQVATVVTYYQRFLQHFPTVADLAAAPEDQVMRLWAGLGYYSRARNLHRCAQQVVQDWGGQFPPTAQALQSLPGIGPSTAAAIAAFCYGERVAIFDGNVARVLARHSGFGADLSQAAPKRELWALASALLPTEDLPHTMPRYTQAMMDLGATVCTPRQPQCPVCPLQSDCLALAQGRVAELPFKAKRTAIKPMNLYFLWLQSGAEIALCKRPASGIWGGLYALPEISEADYAALRQQAGYTALPPITHLLTHRRLQLHVLQAKADNLPLPPQAAWHGLAQLPALGLPQPFAKLLA